jgi:Mg-chelatase subunit ChlD
MFPYTFNISMQTPEDNFYCPITLGIMMDPVIGSDGQTYERSAIENWLKANNKSPLTKQPMEISSLISNIALRNTIQQYLIQNPNIKSHKKSQPKLETNRNINIESKLISNNKLFIKLQANDEPKRKPSIFIFILDVSGSMDTQASPTNSQGETDGFSRLDLVKHSVRTVIEVLEPQDSISIITFSDDAKLKLDLTSMTDDGKKHAIEILENIRTEGWTNIWDGLRVGLLNVQKITNTNANISMVLLTDGEPNKNPPRGIVPTLISSLETLQLSQSFTINTFGFGYSLDSHLLNDISNVGSGTYGYIPDSSMVGTIFVNYLSNVLATYLSNSHLLIKSKDKLLQTISIGSILFDQPRDYIIEFSEEITDNLELDLMVGNNILVHQIISKQLYPIDSEIIDCQIRNQIIKTLTKSIIEYNSDSMASINDNLNKLYQEIYSNLNILLISSNVKNNLMGYYMDWESTDQYKGGQIKQAFSKLEWFNKWGKHFLLSLTNAYLHQQCNNFKDPGVQNFGGKLFNQIRTQADSVFCMLPAPKPSFGNCRTVNMSTYYNVSGSCYDGNGLVSMANGTFLRVSQLKIGDIVESLDVNNNLIHDKVRCVVKSKVSQEFIEMCLINGIYITPWHPIKYNQSWIFPINISQEYNVEIDWIYNVVLENGCCLFINTIPVITLGHNLNDPIAYHPYYGTQLIINDLSQMYGWNEGCVILNNPTIMRTNGFVNKFCLFITYIFWDLI